MNFQQKQLVFDGKTRWVDGSVFDNSRAVKKTFKFNVGDYDDGYLQFEYDRNNPNKWGGLFMTELDFYEGTTDRLWQPAPEDATLETDKTLEATQTKLTLIQGSFAFQNLTSAGSIISQINATNNQILIEAEKIRLKGKTLLDELTAIDGYFKRLFVGEGNFAKLNAEIIGSRTITADKLIMDQAMARMFVSSDIFTDTLAAKEAFINKLRSVVVSATLLEGYKGKIGGFQIGTHDKDPSTYWLTGQNQFAVGMSNGSTQWGQTSLWVNWGDNWNKPGDTAWFVKRTGEMFCYNRAYFWNTPVINGDLRVTGDIYYNNKNSGKSGYWIYSPQYKQIFSENGYMYFVWGGGGSDWIPMNKEISDRRYKSNIEASTVSALDVIERFKTYSYRKEYNGKIEDIACGIMAQDVQQYAPEAFYENPDGAYSYRTFELVPYLIKAIQELNQKIQKLEKTA
jgi:pblB